MGMYDTIIKVPIKCPNCGDDREKEVQIKSGPQSLNEYVFGEDKISLNWDYSYYGAVIERIDDNNGKIRGVAECEKYKNSLITKNGHYPLFFVVITIKNGIAVGVEIQHE